MNTTSKYTAFSALILILTVIAVPKTAFAASADTDAVTNFSAKVPQNQIISPSSAISEASTSGDIKKSLLGSNAYGDATNAESGNNSNITDPGDVSMEIDPTGSNGSATLQVNDNFNIRSNVTFDLTVQAATSEFNYSGPESGVTKPVSDLELAPVTGNGVDLTAEGTVNTVALSSSSAQTLLGSVNNGNYGFGNSDDGLDLEYKLLNTGSMAAGGYGVDITWTIQ